MPMTSEAKGALAKTIRALRERLLRDLHDEAESVYRLGVRGRPVTQSRRLNHNRLAGRSYARGRSPTSPALVIISDRLLGEAS